MCLLASQDQNCLTSGEVFPLTSFTLLTGWVWLWKTSGSVSKWKSIPSKLHRAKSIFPHCTMFILDLCWNVRTPSYLHQTRPEMSHVWQVKSVFFPVREHWGSLFTEHMLASRKPLTLSASPPQGLILVFLWLLCSVSYIFLNSFFKVHQCTQLQMLLDLELSIKFYALPCS